MTAPENRQSDPRTVRDVFAELSESGPAVQRREIQARIADDQEARDDAKRRHAVTGALLALKGKPPSAPAMAETAGPTIAQTRAEAGEQMMESALEAVTRINERSLVGFLIPSETSARLTERAARQPSLNFSGGVGFSEMVHEISSDWLSWVEDSLQANVRGWRALLSCRSAAEVAAVQSRLLEDHLEIFQHDRRSRAPAD